jgi:hypothetical protein
VRDIEASDVLYGKEDDRCGCPPVPFSIQQRWLHRRRARRTIDALVRLGLALPHRIEGGAAVDAEGRLIGLAVADPRRQGLVIPTSTVERAVAALAEKGRVGRGYLGLTMQPLRGGGRRG